MQVYQASIRYDENTIARMDRAINDSFFFSRKICFLGICIALIAGGALMGVTTTMGIIALLTGRNARQVLRAMRGRTLKMEYTFSGKKFTCAIASGDTSSYEYDSIIRLVEEKDYLYLFQKPTQACMVDIASLCPNQLAEFKESMTKKTGLQWTKPLSILSFSFRQCRFNRENTRRR